MNDDWGIVNPDAWLDAAFGRIVQSMRDAGPGSRNTTARSAAFRWGRIRHIANGQAERFDHELLSAALNTGLGRKEAETTIRRGIRDGEREKTDHYIASPDMERAPRLRILRSGANPTGDDPPTFDTRAADKTTPEQARAIWAAAVDYMGTPAEAYMQSRGLSPASIHADIRYSRSADYHYCVFPVRDAAGDLCAVQRVSIDESGAPWTWPDGRKRKLTVGEAARGAFHALEGEGPAVVCEGPEDALSIAAALMAEGEARPVLAALTRPTRLLAEGVTWFADRDGTLDEAKRAAQGAGALLCAPQGPHKDANDLWRASGAQGVVEARKGAEAPRPMFSPASDLEGVPVPPREWHVADLIPLKTVTMLGGDGGTGKSLLALQLAVATATAGDWIGREVVKAGPVLFMSAEDDADELHRRLDDICTEQKICLADLGNLLIRSLAGENAILAELDRKTNALSATPLYHAVDKAMEEAKPAALFLDTLADLHSGDENNRTHARQFIGLLRGLALRHSCAVILLAHPSLSGMSSGSGLSGSTAWNGSVRSRLYLERVQEDGYEADPDVRRLVSKKANYARTGQEITLRWKEGIFVPEGNGSSLDRMAASEKAKRVFMKCLDQFTDEGRNVSPSPSSTYAPALFAKSPLAEGCTKRAFESAMEELFIAGVIEVGSHGRDSKTRKHIRRKAR